MNEVVLKEVLTEVLEEQKQLTVSVGLLTTTIEKYAGRMDVYESKLASFNDSVSVKQVTRLLSENTTTIQKIIATQPKAVIHEKRILLFPETYRQEFYKIIWGRLLMWMVILIVSLKMINAAINFTDNSQYKTAWQLLYKPQKPATKKWLDSLVQRVK